MAGPQFQGMWDAGKGLPIQRWTVRFSMTLIRIILFVISIIMKTNIFYKIALSAIICIPILSCVQSRKDSGIPIVIFDTDLGNDIDDVLALQMLFNYAHEELIDLRGVTISKCNPHSIEVVDGLCRYNGFEDMPLGYAYNGVTPEDNSYLLPTLAATFEGRRLLNPKRTLSSGIPEGYKALRKWLSGAADTSVVLIAVGPLTNIGRLIDSRGDEISPLSGVELMKKKVKLFEIMGGEYSRQYNDFAEYNITSDLAAAKSVIEKSPVGIIASGWEVGSAVRYPHESILQDFGDPLADPLCVAYMHYQPMPYDRECWDLTAVLDAVEGDNELFGRSVKGRIIVNEKGITRFVECENGEDAFLILDSAKIDQVVSTLVKRVVGKVSDDES